MLFRNWSFFTFSMYGHNYHNWIKSLLPGRETHFIPLYAKVTRELANNKFPDSAVHILAVFYVPMTEYYSCVNIHKSFTQTILTYCTKL